MNNYFLIYLLTRLDSLQDAAVAAIFFSIFIVVAHVIAYALTLDELDKPYVLIKGWRKWLLTVLFAVSVLIKIAAPTRNEAIIILAGGKTLDYVQSDTSLQKIPYQTTKIVSDYLDKTLKEINEQERAKQ